MPVDNEYSSGNKHTRQAIPIPIPIPAPNRQPATKTGTLRSNLLYRSALHTTTARRILHCGQKRFLCPTTVSRLELWLLSLSMHYIDVETLVRAGGSVRGRWRTVKTDRQRCRLGIWCHAAASFVAVRSSIGQCRSCVARPVPRYREERLDSLS